MMDGRLRTLVIRRAGNRCEYCRLPHDANSFVRFHVEHIIARQHGGSSDAENLALACHHCNHFKGPNIAALDPDTGALVRLFHPRRDEWAEHFVWRGVTVVGSTPIGRGTAQLLAMNSRQRIELRESLKATGLPFFG